MSQISELCEAIMSHMRAKQNPTPDFMLPGIPRDELLETVAKAELPFVLADSIIDLYSWSAGVSPESGRFGEFFPGYVQPRFSYILKLYKELSTDDEWPRFADEDKKWFPVFMSTGTDFYGVRCDDSPHIDNEVIVDYSVDQPEKRFHSLTSMIQTIEKAYATGVYYLEEDGTFDFGKVKLDSDGNLESVDVSEFKKIALEFNPEIEHFKR